jgi:hypothetical protein
MQGGLLTYMRSGELDKKDPISVELNDLDWEDRERILRLLFSKMNTGETASDWRRAGDES